MIDFPMTIDLAFNPEMRLIDGTVIRDGRDAIAFAPELARSGSVEGREILGLLESATRPEECKAAAQRLRGWIIRLGLLA
jgi:hypothetical protein